MAERLPGARVALVVADDLTGANATGVLLVKAGLRGITLLSPDAEAFEVAQRWVEAGPAGVASAVLVSTDSRALPPPAAARRVRLALELAALRFGPPRLVSKRIDSTARGNVGPEVAAALDVLGPGSFAVVTPAYPASGRQVVGGYLLVNGVPVVRTGAARDPLSPVRQAHMPTLLEGQQALAVGQLPLNIVLAGAGAVRAELERLLNAGRRLIVADATSDEDLDALAEAVVDLVRSKRSGAAVLADPGPLTATAVAKWLQPSLPEAGLPAAPLATGCGPGGRCGQGGPVLVVAGSATSLTRAQLAQLEAHWSATLATVDIRRLLGRRGASGTGERRSEVDRLAGHLVAHWSEPVTGLRTSRSEADLVEGLTPAENGALLAALGEAVRTALGAGGPAARRRPAGLYLTGGDVTAAVIRALGAAAVELVEEVLPLAALGRLVGGALDGTPLVTKGGLVGDERAAIRCVERLMAHTGGESFDARIRPTSTG